MNRKERRAAQSLGPDADKRRAEGQGDVMALFMRAIDRQDAGDTGSAIRLFKKVLELKPDHFAACERLANAYLVQGKRDKASEQSAELLRLAPQLLADFDRVVDTLKALMPELAADLANPASAPDIGAPYVRAIIANPYLQTTIEHTPVVNAPLERWLTALRASILHVAARGEFRAGEGVLAFCSALARQCFINEYVFFVTPEETELLAALKTTPADVLDAGAVTTLAMYVPLHELAGADTLAARSWPSPVAAVVTQQIVERREEIALRRTIKALTPIAEGLTAQVRQQYEENPYPRWSTLAAPPWPLLKLDDHLRRWFPSGPFRPVGHEETLDVLVVGCGTGRYVLELAQSYVGAHVLGIDLSLSSLAHVKRKTPQWLAGKVELGQADIMAIGSLDRRFDLINATGVFHHMPDPWAGWREVIKLMKPDGVMQVGLYSAYARRDILTARQIIAERGYRPTPDDIRRLRHDLAVSGDNFTFMTYGDYFTVSTCRDLLFHVHEIQTTIPEIKAFLAENGLRFLGFDFGSAQGQEQSRSLFARNGWSLTDLDRWDAVERDNQQTFAGMYIFWVQKA